MKGFWKTLKKPIFVLAPLANVTDAAFRRLIAEEGKPCVFWTEFVSADGLDSEGREKLLPDLIYSEAERPIVAQIFSAHPDKVEKASKVIHDLGFDGIDINMGCPDRAVVKQGAGAALVKNHSLAQEVIRAAQKGGNGLPVSVKVRLGDTRSTIEEWIPALLETRPAVITVHGRTRKEMSKVPAHWDEIARVVEIRNEWSARNGIAEDEHTLILGNGDVCDLRDADEKVQQYRVDGVMLGRAIFGNPWLFSRRKCREDLSEQERLRALLKHTELFDTILGEKKPFHIMRKHFSSYVTGFQNAKELREKLMATEKVEDVRLLIREELRKLEISK